MSSIRWIGITLLGLGAVAAYAVDEEKKTLEYTVYGRAHVSVEHLNNGTDSSEYLSSNSSRIGFKGNAEVTEVLQLIWQIEATVNLDESGGQFATRNSFAGLKGAYGTILAGRHDSPFKQLGRTADLFGDRIGDSRNIIGLNTCGCDLRLDNVIIYTSPNLKGLTLQAARTTRDGADDTDVTGASAVYRNGNLLVGAAYEQHGTMLTPVDSDGDEETDSPSAKGESGVRVAGSYKVGKAKITGLYENLMDVGGTSGADRSSWGLGVSYTLGKVVAQAQYYTTDGVDARPNTGAAMYVVGCDYKLGDRTSVYLAYAMTDNEDNVANRMSGGAHGEKVTPALGKNPSGVAVGLIHDF